MKHALLNIFKCLSLVLDIYPSQINQHFHWQIHFNIREGLILLFSNMIITVHIFKEEDRC